MKPRSSASHIEARGLTKRYGAVDVVRGVDLDIPAGEIFGFLGPNGAGKSTTIGMLCTLTKPTSGRAWVAGHDVERDPVGSRRSIGLVFQESTLDLEMTAAENLWFHGRLYGMAGAEIRRRSERLLDVMDLLPRARSSVRTWSGGMKRRLEIARALLHSPRVLVLDEPTNGLDPQSRAQVWSSIRQLCEERGTTVFLTTHYMDEADNCERIAIIDKGTIVAQDSPQRFKQALGQDRVVVRTEDGDAVVDALRDRFGVSAQHAGDGVRFTVADAAAFVPRLFQLDVPITAISMSTPTLDDVFMTLAGRSIRDSDGSTVDRLNNTSWLPMVR
jgi:ABC-2 type transport system ATP-binding protein